MGAGQPQILAQELDQQGTGIDVGVDGIAVHDQGNLGHQHSLACPAAARKNRRFRSFLGAYYGPVRQWATSGATYLDMLDRTLGSWRLEASPAQPWRNWRRIRQPASWRRR